MSDRLLKYTSFIGVGLDNGTTIRQIAPLELDGDVAIVRKFRLSNGVVFDADGSGDGAKTYGMVRATFRITGTNQAAANATLAALEALLNRKGSLVGVEYGASAGTNKSCTARCEVARPILRAQLAMAAGKTYQIEVEMAWQRYTAWV